MLQQVRCFKLSIEFPGCHIPLDHESLVITLMNATETNTLLNRLRIVHSRSLVAYLRYAAPWIRKDSHGVVDTLETMADEVQRTADRLGEMILSGGGEILPGEFPLEFTGFHDLSLDYLLGVLIQRQENDIATIQNCIEPLTIAPLAQALAEESLGAAKGNLDSLQELVASQSDA